MNVNADNTIHIFTKLVTASHHPLTLEASRNCYICRLIHVLQGYLIAVRQVAVTRQMLQMCFGVLGVASHIPAHCTWRNTQSILLD
jgi:hypothetical protein